MSDGVYTLDVNTLGITKDSSGLIEASASKIVASKNVTYNLEHCTIEPSNITAIKENDTISFNITANKNYFFTIAPIIDFHNRSITKYTFTKVSDTVYTFKHTFTNSDLTLPQYNIVIEATAIYSSEIVNKYGAIQIYNPTKKDMLELSKKRFRANAVASNNIVYQDVDLGVYITQFKRVFFDFVVANQEDILLGVHNTEIKANTIDNDDVIIDLGNYLLQGANSNELDKKIYTIQILLPFFGIVDLPSEYINETINIKYKCNVITGYADIELNEVKKDVLINISNYRAKVSQDLPYIINVEQLKSNLEDLTLNVTPKIILHKKETFIDNGYETFKKDLISNELNYFEIQSIEKINIDCLSNEFDLITNELKNGVYLKPPTV